MRLLLDQNLSLTLVERLLEIYPGYVHVAEVELDRASDRELWDYARLNKLTIVTKDADFSEMSVLRGPLPYVVWIRRGNCTMSEIEHILRRNKEAIKRIKEDPQSGTIELY